MKIYCSNLPIVLVLIFGIITSLSSCNEPEKTRTAEPKQVSYSKNKEVPKTCCSKPNRFTKN